MPDSPIPSSVILTAHLLVTGPAQELQHFLKDRCKKIVLITHPLQPFTPVGDHRSIYQVVREGAVESERSVEQWNLPASNWVEMLFFARHAWLTFSWAIRNGWGSDLFVGVNPLNAFTGLFLKQLGCVRRVIYYTIDYVPDRFSNRWVNRLYHWIDRTCVRGCDQTWNLSLRMVTARESRGVGTEFRNKQITVPIGTDLRVQPMPIDKIDRHAVVYFGGLMEKQGVQLGIEALALLRRSVPQARMVVIGGGSPDRMNRLKELALSLGIADRVEFTGVIEDHNEALERISRGAVGIAPYTDDPDNFTQYTDPGKPKAYLAAGLPVVMTGVPEIAQTIAQAGAGFVVPYDAQALADSLSRLLTDELLFISCRQKARLLAEQYDWEKLFNNAFERR